MKRMFTLISMTLLCGSGHAESTSQFDWPQWQGPDRNAISKEPGLLQEWPENGPPLQWQIEEIGGGYSAPAIAAGRIYGMSNLGDDEVVWARSEKDGAEIWTTRIGPAATQGMRQGREGPGCTPTVVGERLFIIGAAGTLACLQTSDGSVVWRRNLISDFGGQLPTWRYNESPLVDGDRVICTPGGKEATLVALNKSSGDQIWRSQIPNETEVAQNNNRGDRGGRPNGSRAAGQRQTSRAPAEADNSNVAVVVPAGARWKYLDTGTDPGPNWTTLEFNDAPWQEGTAQLGCGDNDEKTRISDNARNYPTYYFRREFKVTNPDQLKPLVLRLIKDDGAIVYINGAEVCRDNMPPGKVSRDTFAEATTEIESEFYVHDVNAKLVAGNNVIAVEVHQASANSSDVSFDLELREKLPSDRPGVPPARPRRFGRGGRGGWIRSGLFVCNCHRFRRTASVRSTHCDIACRSWRVRRETSLAI